MPVYDKEKPKERSRGFSQHDIARQEEQAAAPNTSAQEVSPDDLGAAERAGNGFGGGNDDTIGKGYTDNDNDGDYESDDQLVQRAQDKAGKRGGVWQTRRRRVAVGGGIAGVIIGAGIGIFSLGSGPAEFIQIAKLLEQFHFSQQQDADNSRFMQILRYIRDPKSPQNTRMGYLGNKYANRIENRMYTESGFSSNYTEKLGFLDTMSLDTTMYAMSHPEAITDPAIRDHINKISATITGDLGDQGSALYQSMLSDSADAFRQKMAGEVSDQLKKQGLTGASMDELQTRLNKLVSTHLQTTYGIKPASIGTDPGHYTLSYSFDGKSYFAQKSIIKASLREAGYSKITAAIAARVMGKRGGIDWHPIRRLDAKILKTAEARYLKWKETRNSEIQNGAGNPDLVTTDESDPKDKTANQNATDAQDSTSSVSQEGSDASTKIGTTGDTTGPITALQNSLTAKISLGGLAAVGVVCMAEAVVNESAQLQWAQKALPLMRIGMRAMAIGGQIMAGNPDIDLNQLGWEANMLSDKTSDWSGAKSIEAELGQPQTGPDIDGSARIDTNNPLQAALDAIPGLHTVCKAANSTAGQVVQIGISFIGGPISAIVGAGLGAIFGPIIVHYLAQLMAGQAVNTGAAGAALGNYMNYGGRYASNDTAISQGGVALNNAQEAELDSYEAQQYKQEFQSHSWAYRMFSPNDSRTLVGSLIDHTSGSSSTNLDRVAGIFTNVGHTLAALPQKMFAGKASADAGYSYGFAKYGFTKSMLEDPRFKNPEENTAVVTQQILTGSNGQQYIDRAKGCFGLDISTTDVTGSAATSPSYDDISKYDCTDQSEDWLRVRFYILDTSTMKATACYMGDNQSCTDMGF